jgi:hypothetical protein
MVGSLSHHPKALFALGGIVLAMCLSVLLGSPTGAMASETHYCYNQTLPGWNQCVGTQRTLNALFGQGTQHSVCVWASRTGNGGNIVGSQMCSSGGGQGVYNSSMGLDVFYPYILENAPGSGTVFGVSYAP